MFLRLKELSIKNQIDKENMKPSNICYIPIQSNESTHCTSPHLAPMKPKKSRCHSCPSKNHSTNNTMLTSPVPLLRAFSVDELEFHS